MSIFNWMFSRKSKPITSQASRLVNVAVINVAIINTASSKYITLEQLQSWLPAFQKYVDLFLFPSWGFTAKLHLFASVPEADPNMWWMVINNTSDDPGALGYHDVQPNGHPFGRVFVKDDTEAKASIPVTITHELAELLGNPYVKNFAMLGGKKWLRELCDAVEDDGQALLIDGVPCSNYVLPNYFVEGSKGPWDYQGKLKGPCPTLTAGGYMGGFDGTHYITVNARLANGDFSYRSQRKGRTLQASMI